MNLLFTVCGRAGSKGLKNKNLKLFLECPLAYYTLAAILQYIEAYGRDRRVDVVLNTDSQELINQVEAQDELPVLVVVRDNALAGDTVPKVSVILDCLEKAEKAQGISYDMVIDLDITSPLRTAEDVRGAIEKKGGRPETDVVFSVVPSRRNPYFNMVREEHGFFVKAIASSFTARQQAPAFYDMNASIYAYSPQALRNKAHATFFNDRADVVVMRDSGVLDIDSEEDFVLMEAVSALFFQREPLFGEILEKARALTAGARSGVKRS